MKNGDRPTSVASTMLCTRTKRRIRHSCPYHRVAVLATTMLCASIILPITPPELFAAAMSSGLTPTCCAVIFWSPPNSTFDDVSDPVSATPSHPNSAPKNG